LVRLGADDWTAAGGMTWKTPIVRMRWSFENARNRNHQYNLDCFRVGINYYPAIILTFDDVMDGVYNYTQPILHKHNAAADIGVTPTFVNTSGKMTVAQLISLQSKGFNLVNHSYDHSVWQDMTQAQVEANIQAAKDRMDRWGIGAHGLHYCFTPGGSWKSPIHAAMSSKGLRLGRITEAQNASGDTNPLYFAMNDAGLDANNRMCVQSYTLRSTKPVATVKALIDKTKRRGTILPFYTHNILEGSTTPSGSNWNQSMLDEVLTYAVTQGLYVLTFHDLYQLSRGSWDVRKPQ
jgi:peptidoglycan/xylan/chitin deacetylase (PgdA/CDA1 family)